MSFGVDSYSETEPWGGVTTSLIEVIGPTALDVNGGDVSAMVVAEIEKPVTILVAEGSSEPYTVVGYGYLFDFDFDVVGSQMFFGTPALPAGQYHVQLIHGESKTASNVLLNALTYKVFSEEVKVHRMRNKWAKAWAVGPKWLR